MPRLIFYKKDNNNISNQGIALILIIGYAIILL